MTAGSRQGNAPEPAGRRDLRAATLAIAAALALGFPPEVHAETGPLVALLLAAGALTLRRLPLAVPAGLALLAGFNLAVSLAPGRTIDTLARLVLPCAAFLVAREVERERRRPVLGALLAVGAGLGALALLQRFFLLPREALAARAARFAPEVVDRLASGRAFGTHVVPAALGGALVLALCCAGALLATRARRRGPLVLGAALAAAGLAATASLGAFAGALAAAGLLLAGRARALGRRRLLLAAAALALLLAAIVAARPAPIFDLSRPDHPLTLRAGNWRGALLVALRRPVAGTGLGSFGALYPAVRRPGDSETVYAHDSWLQLAAEGGLPVLALLALAAAALWRRRQEAGGETRWLLAGCAAFAAHNLVDFTAYLPGVAVPAAALAGLAFPAPDRGPAERRRGGAGLLALALLLAAGLLAGTAAARRALEAAERAPAAALGVAAAPWNPRLAVRAGRLLRASDPASAAALAVRARRWDPEAPAPEHLLGDLALDAGAPARAWRHLRLALARHPASPDLREKVAALERSFARAGLTAPGVDLPPPRPAGGWPWERWDDLLLAVHLLALLLLCWRWRAGGPAPAEALGLALVIVLAAWGEGGALPGARLGRQLLVAAAAFACLWPRRRPAPEIPAGALLATLPAALWLALAAALAPDRSGARDGLAALCGLLLILFLSASLARRHESWPRAAAVVAGAAAAGPALLYALQRGLLWGGAALADAPVPLRVAASRPAADFLHPGHLGTFLVAAALPLIALGTAPGRAARRPLAAGALLLLAGASTAARATLFLALPAGLLTLVLTTSSVRLRRAALGLFGLGLAGGLPLLAARFQGGDPFAFARLAIWPAALRAALEAPLFGFGPGGFRALAPQFAFPQPEGPVLFARVFRGPHSDPIGLLLAGGLPGALLALGALALLLRRALREARDGGPVAAGLLAALAALFAHGLADDLLSARPAAAVMAALFLGALAGRRADARALPRGGRAALGVALATLALAGELLPYAADRALRAGAPELAAALDPARDDALLAAARAAAGAPLERVAAALDRTRRAARALKDGPAPWRERALVLDAACRGPLPERATCRDARAAWGAALARLPRDVLARRGRARLLAALGERAAAAADLEIALRWEPDFLGARADLTRLLLDAGRPAAARRELARLARSLEAARGAAPVSDYERTILDPPPPARLSRLVERAREGGLTAAPPHP